MNTSITLVPDDALLFDVARRACAAHVHLISNGTRFALSPVIPSGWHAVPVSDKSGQIRRAV
jgi:hypothetical protein